MRTGHKIIVTLVAAAAIGAFGLQTAQAAPSGNQSCAVESRQTHTTTDHYALTNIRANYRSDAPKTNAFAVYTLLEEPRDCVDGEFFVIDVLTGRLLPMANGSTTAQDWRQVSFTLTSGQRFVQVMHGDPNAPWNGTFIGSVSRLLP